MPGNDGKTWEEIPTRQKNRASKPPFPTSRPPSSLLSGARPSRSPALGVAPTASSHFSNLRVHAHADVPCRGWILYFLTPKTFGPEFWIQFSCGLLARPPYSDCRRPHRSTPSTG